MQTKRIVPALLLAALVAGLLLLLPPELNVPSLLLSRDPAGLATGSLRSAGPLAVPLLLLLILVSAIVVPIPNFVPAILAGTVFGFWPGFLLSLVGFQAGACIDFYLSRVFGRGVLERMAGKRMASLDRFWSIQGFRSILVLRLVPMLSFDIVSYAAGLVKVRFRDFFLATLLGMLPGSAVVVYFGTALGSFEFLGAVAAGVTLLVFFLLPVLHHRLAGKPRGPASP